MPLSDNLKKLRLEADLTQKDLADKIFVTPQAVSRWENGEVEPSIDTLNKLADIYQVSLDKLMGRPEPVVEAPRTEVINQAVIQQPVAAPEAKVVLAVCEVCNRPIYDPKEIVRGTHHHSSGRSSHSTGYVKCSSCVAKAVARKKAYDIERSEKRRKFSFIFGGISAAVALMISLVVFIPTGDISSIIGWAIFSLLFFPFVSCLILNNNFIGEMMANIFSWGFVQMPGLIFSLDLDGIVWLLTVKLLFWVIGILLAIAAGILAIIVGLVVSIFIYPFALRTNRLNPEKTEE